MHPPVVTKNPTAVEGEVQAAYLAIFPGGDKTFVPRAFSWAIECFSGRFEGYQAIDAPYHDLEHTLQGALCMARLLHGRCGAGAQPELTSRMFELGILAILLHDTGYLKKRNDTQGTGAKYTVTHVARSATFANELLSEKGFSPGDIKSVQNMIQCTGLDAPINKIAFQNELERIVGHTLGTADLLGQMAAEDYVEKLPLLYSEFDEAKRFAQDQHHFISLFSTAEELMQKTPEFWEKFVQVKLSNDFGGMYRFLNNPYPDGRNEYLERIQNNIERLRRQISTASV